MRLPSAGADFSTHERERLNITRGGCRLSEFKKDSERRHDWQHLLEQTHRLEGLDIHPGNYEPDVRPIVDVQRLEKHRQALLLPGEGPVHADVEPRVHRDAQHITLVT